MAFQFLCPQGHLLESDESQAGQQSQCPYCGSLFLIPQPAAAAPLDHSTGPPPAPPETGFQAPLHQQPTPGPPSFYQQPEVQAPPFQQAEVQAPWFQQPAVEPSSFQQPAAAPPGWGPPPAEAPAAAGGMDFPGIRTEPKAGRGGAAADVPSRFEVPSAAGLAIVHVICPNGHQLETPREMLDQEALCPFCQVQFRLRLEDSIEYREQRAKEQERREIRAGQLWLRWAIAAAVVVLFGLIVLIAFSASR